jgi:hypothetical protein
MALSNLITAIILICPVFFSDHTFPLAKLLW